MLPSHPHLPTTDHPQAVHDYGIGSWPRRRARIRPGSLALRHGDHTLTYAELAGRVDYTAAALIEHGVRAGDRVAYLGYNSIAAYELFFAVCRIGAIFVPLNTRLSALEVGALLDDCSPVALFYGADQSATVESLTSAQRPALACCLRDENKVEVGADHINDGRTTRFTTSIDIDDDAVILYTSGTTGRPKGAVLTHANLTFNAMNQLAHVDVLSTDTALCVAPMFHATGLAMVALPTLFKGGTVVVTPRFDAATVLATIAEYRVTSFAAVPTMLQMLCEHPDFAATDLGSLRYVIYGGSSIAERTVRRWNQRAVDLLQGYGMTEASPGVTLALPHTGGDRPLSAGTVHFFTDIDVDSAVGPASGERAGELLVRGLNMSRGYWGPPQDVPAADGTGWFRSGDVVRISPDHQLSVLDRVKDMIISGGENIFPAEIEALARTIPGIADCAVIGIPDQRWGEVGAAYVVPTSDSRWTADRLRNTLRENIAAYKVPQHVVFTDDLPRNATGKIDKQLLRARFLSSPVNR
ncbi:long-chain fatty acid--CoA ligase [Nocardia tengchongensis]|uniref:acyl-CoA synthetase n=1 Tax=Nocardia tengchongensis TaxID=2055889 RepID=UPI0036B2A958